MSAMDTTLADFMGHHHCAGVNPSPRAIFILDKSQRDRLVLLDPQLAPLLRRYHTSDDVQRYTMLPSTRFVLCLPAGWTTRMCATTASGNDAWQGIAERFPALSRHLALAVAERPFTTGHWWELSADTILPPAHTTLTWAHQRTHTHFAAVQSGTVCATPWYQQCAPWLLGYLNSLPVQRWLQRTSVKQNCDISQLIDRIPVPATLVAHTQLDALAHAAMGLVAQRQQLIQSGVLTLLRNFAPLGATPSAPLKAWYDLDFAGLRKALLKAFKNDIPERVHPEWHDWLSEQHQHHAMLSQHIHEHDVAINAIVADVLVVPKG